MARRDASTGTDAIGEPAVEEGLLARAAFGERYIALAERRPSQEAFLYGWLANRVGPG